jgi:hypothetical protein
MEMSVKIKFWLKGMFHLFMRRSSEHEEVWGGSRINEIIEDRLMFHNNDHKTGISYTCAGEMIMRRCNIVIIVK